MSSVQTYSLTTNFVDTLEVGLNSLYAHFQKTVKLYGNYPFLGTRECLNGVYGKYIFKDYDEINEISARLGSSFRSLDLISPAYDAERKLECIGIYAKTREEWIVIELAAMRQGITVLALYDTLGDLAMEVVINETNLKLLACSQDLAPKILKLKPKLPYLKYILQFEPVTEEQIKEAKLAGLILYSYTDLIKSEKIADTPPEENDIYTISYTSGTTGIPKGVMLSHRNIIAQLAGLSDYGFIGDPKDVVLCFLPMAHVYGKIVLYHIITAGGSIGFYHGVLTELLNDAQELKPTVFTGVPRIYSRLYDEIINGLKLKPKIVQKLFKIALNYKLKNLKNQGTFTSFLDRFFFSKIKSILGGKTRFLASGGAPLKEDVFNFLQVCFSTPLGDTYGQTESTGTVTSVYKPGFSKGTAGRILRNCEIQLRPAEEVSGTEIYYRGPIRMIGYFNREIENKEAIDEQGWLRSGDIGIVTADGELKIIDRVKNFFKLSQGEYIAPDKLENAYATCSSISQIFVTGIITENWLVAIIVPDFKALRLNFPGISQKELCSRQDVKQYIIAEIKITAKENNFNSLEVPKQIYLHEEPFTEANGLLTPTQKIKRISVKSAFEEIIENLYTLPPIN